MQAASMMEFLDLFKAFGAFGVVMVIWFFDSRNIRQVLERYKDDMAEIRRMYENNVLLVKNYESVSNDLKDLVILNTQTMTHLTNDIDRHRPR